MGYQNSPLEGRNAFRTRPCWGAFISRPRVTGPGHLTGALQVWVWALELELELEWYFGVFLTL
jgi:hypothetical protein